MYNSMGNYISLLMKITFQLLWQLMKYYYLFAQCLKTNNYGCWTNKLWQTRESVPWLKMIIWVIGNGNVFMYCTHPYTVHGRQKFFFVMGVRCHLVKVLLAATITPWLISPTQLTHAYEGGTEGQTTKLGTQCYSFVNRVWVLQCPTVLLTNKRCEMGPLAYSNCPRRIETLTICHSANSLFWSSQTSRQEESLLSSCRPIQEDWKRLCSQSNQLLMQLQRQHFLLSVIKDHKYWSSQDFEITTLHMLVQLEAWEGLLFVTDVSTTCAEAIFRVKW